MRTRPVQFEFYQENEGKKMKGNRKGPKNTLVCTLDKRGDMQQQYVCGRKLFPGKEDFHTKYLIQRNSRKKIDKCDILTREIWEEKGGRKNMSVWEIWGILFTAGPSLDSHWETRTLWFLEANNGKIKGKRWQQWYECEEVSGRNMGPSDPHRPLNYPVMPWSKGCVTASSHPRAPPGFGQEVIFLKKMAKTITPRLTT